MPGIVQNITIEDITAQSAAPEPGTWALMLLGFGGMGGAMRRRRAMAGVAQTAKGGIVSADRR